MGAYLSQPVTRKDSSDGSDASYAYGTSSMQGWRTNMEVRRRRRDDDARDVDDATREMRTMGCDVDDAMGRDSDVGGRCARGGGGRARARADRARRGRDDGRLTDASLGVDGDVGRARDDS